MKIFLSYFRFSVVLQTFLVLALGAGISWYVGDIALRSNKGALVTRAQNIAVSLDADMVERLQGNENDLSTLDYLYLKKKMVELKRVNQDARYIYIMGYRQDLEKLFFFVDSESPDALDTYSPPGQVYGETRPIEIENFLQGIPYTEGPFSDRWGRWISASAPVISERTGLPIAIVGLDVDASAFTRDIFYTALMPFIFSCALAIILLVLSILRTRQRNEELGTIKLEFTSFMSHEIKSYVTKLQGGLKDLSEERFGILTEDQKGCVLSLVEESDGFAELIEEFLDIGKLEQDNDAGLNKADYNLLDIVKGIVSDASQILGKKNITVIYEGNVPEHIYSPCDNEKIGRVFSNVLQNAIKYSPERSAIHIGYIDANTMHTISIKDGGIGIPEEEKEKIFKKFYRASNARERHTSGTGLGLYFSRIIVERHGGKIWFESKDGRGTTFYIALPKKAKTA